MHNLLSVKQMVTFSIGSGLRRISSVGQLLCFVVLLVYVVVVTQSFLQSSFSHCSFQTVILVDKRNNCCTDELLLLYVVLWLLVL